MNINMKGLSIEEKAKAYDEALEKAREALNDGTISSNTIAYLQDIFPELKESEDERIRKWLIYTLKSLNSSPVQIDGAYEMMLPAIAWLEKQGEKPKKVTCTQEVEVGNGNIKALITKDYNSIDPHFAKPVDNVKPKFHEGEWIVFNGLTLYVKEVVKGFYRTISKGGIPNSYDWDIDNLARLWTIQDAKDGDVLATWSGAFIYNGNNGGGSCPGSYCGINTLGRFQTGSETHWTGKKVYPATKEQRDILFQKMKEAGYEWDTEKKELSKIEDESENYKQQVMSEMTNLVKDYIRQKPTWSEEDECYMSECIGAIATKDGWSFEDKRKTKHWLEFLKQRIRWKPSDEQIKALHDLNLTGNISYTGQGQTLIELYNDLKKLKG